MPAKDEIFSPIGYGNLVATARIITIVGPDAAPIKRVIQDARERNMLIDASSGHKTRAVLVMDSDHIILSGLTPETILSRTGSELTALEKARYRHDESQAEEEAD